MIGASLIFLFIIVIPAFIIAMIVRKNKEYRNDWNNQYRNMTQNMTQNMNGQAFGQSSQPFIQSPANNAQPNQPSAQMVNTFDPQNNNFVTPRYQPQPQPYRQPKPKREPLGTSTVMLIIGVVLLVLSGIAFAAANWFKASPVERVLTIFFASVVSFMISVLFVKLAKLKETSASFFCIGCMFVSIALLTAGHYKLFGDWFSLHGDGYGLFAGFASAVAAVAVLLGNRFFKFKGLTCTGLGLGSLSIFLAALEATVFTSEHKFAAFSLAVLAVQIVMVLSVYFLRLHEKSSAPNAVKAVADVSIVVYSVIPALCALSEWFEPIAATYIILLGFIFELIVCGIKFNKTYMFVTETVISEILASIIACQISGNDKESITGIVCGAVFLAVYLVNCLIPKLRNEISGVISVIGMIIGAFISIGVSSSTFFAESMIVPAIVSLIILMHTFSSSQLVQQLSGLGSTIVPAAMLFSVIEHITEKETLGYIEAQHIVYGIGAAVMGIIAFVLNYLPEVAAKFTLSHPRKSDIVLYSNIVTGSFLLIFSCNNSKFIWIPMLAGAVLFAASFTLSTNISSILPVMAEILCISSLTSGTANGSKWLQFGMFAVLALVSVFFCRDGIVTKNNGKIKIDTALFTGWLPIFLMFDGNGTAAFLGLCSAAVYAACFVKRNTSEKSSNVLFTVSAFFSTLALLNRPFLTRFEDIVMSKITLFIIALAGAAIRIIWKKYSGGKIVSNIIFIISFTGLILEALDYQTGGNTLFTLIVSTIILIISFMSKSKTWFTVSTVSIALIILYSAVKYFDSLSWWVYLFAAGLILIGIAAINEYFKQKGETIKSKAASLFEGWTW